VGKRGEGAEVERIAPEIGVQLFPEVEERRKD
jgi:hypothetical protein